MLDGVLIGAGDGRYLAYASVLAAVVFVPVAAAVAYWSLGLSALWRVVTLALRERGRAWLVTGAVREY